MRSLIGKRVYTRDGHSGEVIKHYKPTGRGMQVHIKQNDGKIWFCPETDIISIFTMGIDMGEGESKYVLTGETPKKVQELLIDLKHKIDKMEKRGLELVDFLLTEEDYYDIKGLLDLYIKEKENNKDLMKEYRKRVQEKIDLQNELEDSISKDKIRNEYQKNINKFEETLNAMYHIRANMCKKLLND